VDSGRLHRTPSSGLWSNFNYIRVQFGGLRWTPLDPLLWTMVIFNHIRVDSGGLHRTPSSGLWSNFNYIRVQSGGLQWTPSSGLWSNFDYIRVQSGELRRTPPDPPSLDYSQVYFILFQRIPHVTICDTSGVQMSLDESGGVR
jgi:hypothetical protein